jgi:hypothetical protein
LDLSVEDAAAIFIKLHGKMSRSEEGILRIDTGAPRRPDPAWLFQILKARLSETPSTCPPTRLLDLVLSPREAAYLRRIRQNAKRDEWRKHNWRHGHLRALKVLEIAEEEGGRASFFGPLHPENPEALLRQAVSWKAFDGLPRKLKMTAEEITALLMALYRSEGNISEAARAIGQPQRKTARRVGRIRKHLKSRGLVV